MKRAIVLTVTLTFVPVVAGCGGMSAGKAKPAVAFTAVTADGWALSVLRYAPAKADPERMPVILCHGLSYNGQFWDLSPEVSLAKYLQEAGFDVWAVSLRGAGWSTKPPLSRLRQAFRGDLLTAGGVFTSAGRGMLKVNWTVDDHARYDVPTVLDLVIRETKQKQAHWIGHSMGGMIMVAHLSANAEDPRIASFVGLGVPVFVVHPLSLPMQQLARGRGAVEIGNLVVSTNLPALLGQIAGTALPTPIDVLFYNRANVTDDTIRRLNAWGTEDISPGQLAQLIDMVSAGKFTSADGKTDYTANLEQMKVPAFFISGAVDNLATIDSVKPLFNRWGAQTKRFALFGAVNGQRIDYGHDDRVIGKYSQAEIYPAIRQWLEERGPPKPLFSLPGLTTSKAPKN